MPEDRPATKPDPIFEGAPPTEEFTVDLALIEHNLRLTPSERFEQHYRARLLLGAIEQTAQRFYGPVREDTDDGGHIDFELLRYCLQLTPAQRLARAEKVANFILAVCKALEGKQEPEVSPEPA